MDDIDLNELYQKFRGMSLNDKGEYHEYISANTKICALIPRFEDAIACLIDDEKKGN